MERWASSLAAFNTQIASWLSCAPALSFGMYPSGMSHTYAPSLNLYPSGHGAPWAGAPRASQSALQAICDRFVPNSHPNRSDFCINDTSAINAQAPRVDFSRAGRMELAGQEMVLCGLATQEVQTVADQGSWISDHVPPQGGRAHDVFIDRREGLHHQSPVVLYLLESPEDLIPVHVSGARGAPVGLREVDVLQLWSRGHDRVVEALLLDVHVVGVEVDEHVGFADTVEHGFGLRGQVDDVRLVAVDGLHAE